MSISSVEDLYVVDSDRFTCHSSIDMSFAANSPPASVVDFINDPPSPDPSTLSDIDRPSDLMITLDSFIPILKHLPGFYLDQNSYYMIRGSLTEADWTRLRDYTRTVSKFIVTDKDSTARISPTAFLRLARLQHDMLLLPYLSDLVIVDADASIGYLDLLLTPSLKSLKASCIPDAQQSAFCSFMAAIEQEAPGLQTLILGPGRFLPSSLQTISQFNSLRHLELKLEDSKLPFAFFDNIVSLPMLKAFILDARYVSGTMTGDESTALPASIPFPSDNFPNSNAVDGNRNEYPCITPIFPPISFKQLAILHVIGWLPLLKDLISRVTLDDIEDISVTFIRLSYDELKASLAREKVERERKAEEGRRREEVPPTEKLQITSTVYSVGKKRKKAPKQPEDAQEILLKEQNLLKKRLLKEQREERLASISFNAHTMSFTEILRILCYEWVTSLKSLSVCQLGESFQCLSKPPTLPEEVFRKMLRLPAIESLEVKGWILDYIEGVLSAAEPIPNLKCLLLPLGEPNSGISLPALRHVTKTCPKLESFQCNIDSLSPVPEYPIPTDLGLSHGLRTLSVGSSFPPPVSKQLDYLIAHHLYLIFPKLETINTSEDHNEELWVIVDKFVKMFQTARMDDLNRQ